jgi:hypothetical protein
VRERVLAGGLHIAPEPPAFVPQLREFVGHERRVYAAPLTVSGNCAGPRTLATSESTYRLDTMRASANAARPDWLDEHFSGGGTR